ncbi:flavin-containing monooxygenase [Rhodococcus wratislaviensis]|uniref:flavin-containing monooxygenase n=1 Tax=Rhodococcus wratislaviensis TaxID=44752 RepID=UPI00366838B4
MTDVTDVEFDAIVVGAGASGLYALYRLRQAGLRVRILEAASSIGGVWFWNRYPGARCDVESADYSYSFSAELDQEWTWKDRFATQPEIEEYLNFVADKFDLRQDIQFNTRVEAAVFDDQTGMWTVSTSEGETFVVRYCVMATGQLSSFNRPVFKGAERYRGRTIDAGTWPDEQISFEGLRVGVIGTGSTGIQLIPELAKEAKEVVVFQRTPNFSVPAGHKRYSDNDVAELKATYPERRIEVLDSPTGNVYDPNPMSALDDTPENRKRNFARRQSNGAFAIMFSYSDLLTSMEANAFFTEFLQNEIRNKVNDPVVAEDLVPTGYPAGSKRLCVDGGYYETFNRSNVRLVNVKKTPIEEFTETGILVGDENIELDVVIYATGFDAMTGAMTKIDIRGRNGLTLREKWEDGPRAYIGLMITDFPNLFMIAGPGSPSVLGNVIHSAEQHVNWFATAIERMHADGLDTMEPTEQAENDWLEHVAQVADSTVYTKTTSWYLGSNIPGKPRVFMAYLAGTNTFRNICNEIAADNYRGFEFKALESADRLVGTGQ